MDDNLDKSESTDENEEKSETETEYFDKIDSDINSHNENIQEFKCTECRISFKNYEDVKHHNIQKHPIPMYKCSINNCIKWFSSRKCRDKHSENLKSRLHKSTSVNSSSLNPNFCIDSPKDQFQINKNSSNDVIRVKAKRGPKPKLSNVENNKDFLVGLPREQLKRKLMESVVEQIESIPAKKVFQRNGSSPISLTRYSKRRPSLGQLSQTSSVTIPNVSSPKPLSSKGNYNKNSEIKIGNKNSLFTVQKLKPIPDLSHIKVPLLSLDSTFSIEKFSEDLINLLILYDPAEYFLYPLIDNFAPLSSQLPEQINMTTIKRKLKQGIYSNNLENLQNDLLLQYSNGIRCFDEKSAGWLEAAKLYQTTLINIEEAKKKQSTFSENSKVNDNSAKFTILNNSKFNINDRSTYLNIMNPYNNGKISESERIMSIGDQLGQLKSGTQNLLGYKEDRRNKIMVLSYLDYGSNFSFGPSYDSGNAYCSKENSDLLIRAYGKTNCLVEGIKYKELNEIIPDFTLGDDFSLYLMNMFTKDIVKSLQSDDQSISDEVIPVQYFKSNIGIESDEKITGFSTLQTMLDDSWKDLAQLKSFNYQRLSNYQLQPSTDEQNLSEKVTSNLTNLILKTNPESITNVHAIRKVLNCT